MLTWPTLTLISVKPTTDPTAITKHSKALTSVHNNQVFAISFLGKGGFVEATVAIARKAITAPQGTSSMAVSLKVVKSQLLTSSLSHFFRLVAWNDKVKGSSESYNVLYQCKKCSPGCETCTDNSPCLATYNWTFR